MLNKNLQKMTFSTKVYKNRINGQWVASQGTQKFDILDPVSIAIDSNSFRLLKSL